MAPDLLALAAPTLCSPKNAAAARAERALLEVCGRLGIEVKPKPDAAVTWDGATLAWPRRVGVGVLVMHPAWLAHEIAHWHVAAKEQRALQNYGFRRDPHLRTWINASGRGVDHLDPEEMRALWLGIAIGEACGIDPRTAEASMQVRGGEKFETTVARVVEQIAAMGLLQQERVRAPKSRRLTSWRASPKALGLPPA